MINRGGKEMKRMFRFSSAGAITILLFFAMNAQVLAQGYGRTRKLVIEPGAARVQTGASLQFTAKIKERNQTETDTVITWSVDATGFGDIGEDGLFTGLSRGRGYVYASAGDLRAVAHVAVIDTAMGDSSKSFWSHLEITPTDSLIGVGESLQYTAALVDTLGVGHDTTVTWSLRGRVVGSLSDEGFFTATGHGVGLIRATLNRFTATTRVIVAADADTASRDTIRIRFRDHNGARLSDSCNVGDGTVYVISGLRFPLNVLNGGELVFPPGSLSDNIDIDISLSNTSIVNGDSTVTFTDQILNGIKFDVYIDGVLQSPYYFDQPVHLDLPYKQELMDQLGISEENLWIFFYDSEGDYNGDGITNVVIDTVFNKIYADIVHFSDLVIAASECGSTDVSGGTESIPVSHALLGNYPNPFNPQTTIGFIVGGEAMQPVSLTIYNLLGQRVRSLVHESRNPGTYAVTWDGRDEAGRIVPSGVFICRFKAGEQVSTRSMMLLK